MLGWSGPQPTVMVMRFAELGKEAWPADWVETACVLEEWSVTWDLESWPIRACQTLTFVTYKRPIRSAEMVFGGLN